MEHIIQPQYIKNLGRPIGKVSDEKLMAYITEAEQLHVKPLLGDALFIDLLNNTEDEKFCTLLNGGIYNDRCGEVHSFIGLRTALAYYVYAQNVMTGDFESTRYGTVIKNGEHSTHIGSKDRSDAYNNVMEVANAYMRECIRYCKSTGLMKHIGQSDYSAGGITIKRIG